MRHISLVPLCILLFFGYFKGFYRITFAPAVQFKAVWEFKLQIWYKNDFFMLQHSCRTQKNMKNILKTLLAMPGMCKFCAAHSIYAIKKFNALRSPLLKGYGIFGLDLKNWWQQQLEPSFFFNLLLEMKKFGGSMVTIAWLIKKIHKNWRNTVNPKQKFVNTSHYVS